MGENTEEIKGILQSRTIWAAIISIIGLILGMSQEETKTLTDNVMEIVGALMVAGGALGSIVYRMKANKKISGIINKGNKNEPVVSDTPQ